MTTKQIFFSGLVAVALVACGGGSSQQSARPGSHPDQGAEGPHVECGTGAGHHGGGCTQSTTTTGSETTTSDGTAPAADADAGTPAPQ